MQDQCVFITGASAGFGKACAEKFSTQGWRLILAARRMRRLDELKATLNDPSRVHTVQLDVRDRGQVQAAIEALPEAFGEIDVLINNAGLALGLETAVEADLGDWETMLDTNIKGLLYCTRMILPGMVARGCGHIINIGSIAGNWPYPGGNVYGATKAFVQQFSRNLRADLLTDHIRVTNIEPGLAESEFSVVRFKGNREKARQVYRDCDPLLPRDIAEISYWVVQQPARVNINSVEVMPTCQAWGPLAVHRQRKS